MTSRHATNQKQTTKMKTKPIRKIRVGYVIAAIWKNETKTGAHFKVKFSVYYADGAGVKSTESFGFDDLLLVSKAADLAHSWINERQQEEIDQIFELKRETTPAK